MAPERIEFPADYPVKVVLRAQPPLRGQIDAIFAQHFGAQPPGSVSERYSAQGQFLSLTYVPRVTDVEQLRALHADLVAIDGVMMVL